MKKSMLAAILAAVVLATLATPAGAVTRPWRYKECRYQTLDGHMGWNVLEVKKTIQCATRKFGVSTSTAFYVVDRESHFYAAARNASSGACGLWQHMPAYWASRIATANRAWPRMRPFSMSCYDARSNTFAAMWMIRHGGWGPWGM